MNTSISGETVYDIIGAEQFCADCCTASYNGGVLTVECTLADPHGGEPLHMTRSVDLNPAIQYAAERLAEWHTSQHGGTAVSGWTDYLKKAESAVKSVAHNKVVHALYEKAKPYLEKKVGKDNLELAHKAATVYEQAKKYGGPALEKVQQVKAMADAGDPKADYAVKVMKAVGTILTAKEQGTYDPGRPQGVSLFSLFGSGGGGPSLYQTGVNVVSGDELLVGSIWGKIKGAAKGAANIASKPFTASYDAAKFAYHKVRPGSSHASRGPTDHRAASPGVAPGGWMGLPGKGKGGWQGSTGPAALAAFNPYGDHPAASVTDGAPAAASPASAPASQEQGGGDDDGGYDDGGYDDQGGDYDDGSYADDQVSGFFGSAARFLNRHVNPKHWSAPMKLMFPIMTPESQKFAMYKFYGPKGPKMVDQMYSTLDRAVAGHKPSIAKVTELANMAAEGNPKAKALMASIHNHPETATDSVQSSGRFLHRGYRTTAQAMMDLNTRPGLGFSTRELYNRGLGRGITDWRDLAAAAINKL